LLALRTAAGPRATGLTSLMLVLHKGSVFCEREAKPQTLPITS
jgi:hypothetical protein